MSFTAIFVLWGHIFIGLAQFLAKIVSHVFTGLGGIFWASSLISGGIICYRIDYTRVYSSLAQIIPAIKLVGGVNLGCYTVIH